MEGFSLTIRGFGEHRKLPHRGLGQSSSRQRILEHLRSNLVCFGNIFSDYSLSDYLFFTMYIYFLQCILKKFQKSQWGVLTPQTPLGYATELVTKEQTTINVRMDSHNSM